MLKQSKGAIQVILPIILSIIIGDLFRPSIIVALTVLSTFCLASIVAIRFGRLIWQMRIFISSLIYALLFSLGLFTVALSIPSNYKSYYSNHYIENDEFVGIIREANVGKGKTDRVIVDLKHLISTESAKQVSGKLLAYVEKDSASNLKVGDVIQFSPWLIPIKNQNNPGEFNFERFWDVKGIKHSSFISRDKIKVIGFENSSNVFWNRLQLYLKGLLSEKLKHENFTVATALSLGEKSDLSAETRNAFSSAGAMHVLAVSGMHVGILLLIIDFLCKNIKILRNTYINIGLSLVAVWFFAFLTGSSPSVLRAACMFSILSIGTAFGYSKISLSSIIMSACIILLYNPFLLFDIGFQLSYTAMLGISFFFDPISNVVTLPKKYLQKAWDGVALGIAAQIGTLPLTLYYFHQFPNYFILTNLGFLVLAGAALGSVLLFFTVHKVPILSDLVAQLVDFVFTVTISFVKFIEALPNSLSIGFSMSITQVIIAYLLVFMIWYYWQSMNWKMWRTTALIILVFAFFIQFDRKLTTQKQELVILNSNIQTILFKDKRTIFCVFDDSSIENQDKVKFLAEAYSKLRGGRLVYLPLPQFDSEMNKLQIKTNSSNILFSAKATYNSLEIDNEEFLLPTSNEFIDRKNTNIVTGSWLKEQFSSSLFNTSSKAFIKALKSN